MKIEGRSRGWKGEQMRGSFDPMRAGSECASLGCGARDPVTEGQLFRLGGTIRQVYEEEERGGGHARR